MKTARLFQNGQSQAVRLPREYRFVGDKVFVKRVGGAVVLLPYTNPWEPLLESLGHFSPDFMAERIQPETQQRDEL